MEPTNKEKAISPQAAVKHNYIMLSVPNVVWWRLKIGALRNPLSRANQPGREGSRRRGPSPGHPGSRWGQKRSPPPLLTNEGGRKKKRRSPLQGARTVLKKEPTAGGSATGRRCPSGRLQRKKKKARSEARHLPPGHNRMHTVAAVRLETDVRQVKGSKGVVAGPGTSLQDILYGVVPPVKSPGSAHPPNFVGMHGEVRPVAVGETNTGLDPTGHRLSRRCSFPSNLHKQALFGN